MRTNFHWRERFQFEFGFSWKLFPNKDLTWRKWAFDPAFGITLPGQEIKSRWQLPESTSWEVDTRSLQTTRTEKGPAKFESKVLWVHGAIRVFGFDVGAGIFFRPCRALPHLAKS